MRYLLLSALLLVGVSTHAHDAQPVIYNKVHLSAKASSEVENDTLIVHLFARARDLSAGNAGDKVNRDMQWALGQLPKDNELKRRTLNYRTHPQYKDQRIISWQVEQGLRLESADIKMLAQLTGQLQERLHVQGMQFDISPDKRNSQENDLIAAALARFEDRARVVSSAMGFGQYKVINLHLNSNDHFRPQPRMEMMARSSLASPAPPAVEAGSQTLVVQVAGEIELLR